MEGHELIQQLSSFLTGDEIIVSSNGNISRQVYHYLPHPQIYLRGSMGLPISVGLGLSLAKPERKVLTVVGDGNLLMGLGSLATISFVRPSNLKIMILDNNAYATTGNQPTTSGILNYPQLLDGFGLPNVVPVLREDTLDDAKEKIQLWIESPELCVLPAMVDSNPPKLSNIPLHPEEITSSLYASMK
ncbi:MAG: sulfopyruvate decarboxylase subunit beta [Candidatus Thorarchaeota archaeon]|nr:sulfopyruvate decarboxylase subunit beta [Candidatus Thorarchaeota archaeon]